MRDIIVKDVPYKWKFSSSRGDICHSLVTIFSKDKQTRAIIRFRTIDTFTAGNPLNEGMPMNKEGNRQLVNLNCPRYIAELISYLFGHGFDFKEKMTKEFDGNRILLDLGYTDIDHYLL